MSPSDSDIKAVLLVGGLGTRLRSVVQSTPKPMAAVGERPFLELLVRQLCHQDIRRLVMCTGYRAQEIEHDLGDGHSWDVTIEYSREPEALGTAGAVKFAEPFLRRGFRLSSDEWRFVHGNGFPTADLLPSKVGRHRKHGRVSNQE